VGCNAASIVLNCKEPPQNHNPWNGMCLYDRLAGSMNEY